MKSKFRLILLFCVIAVTTHAQQEQTPVFKYGDPAPTLRIRKWIKGTPVPSFEKGKVYVIEFWATWCKPCIAAMPHLSALAREYKNIVAILAVDVYEKKNTTTDRIRAFVDGMHAKMDFQVAIEDTNFTVHDWLEATGTKDNGIPATFVVDAHGRVAWIGRPTDLDNVLRQIVNNTWDIKDASSKRIFNKYLENLDHDAFYKLHRYNGDYDKPGDLGKPDSALLIIDEMITKEPRLTYAPVTAIFTFSALLKINPHKAYEYGRRVIVTSTYEEPAYDSIIGNIEQYSGKLQIPPEIYRLGAEAYQAEMDHFPYPELYITPKRYQTMAKWYLLAGDKSKAIECQQKAFKLEGDKNHRKAL